MHHSLRKRQWYLHTPEIVRRSQFHACWCYSGMCFCWTAIVIFIPFWPSLQLPWRHHLHASTAAQQSASFCISPFHHLSPQWKFLPALTYNGMSQPLYSKIKNSTTKEGTYVVTLPHLQILRDPFEFFSLLFHFLNWFLQVRISTAKNQVCSTKKDIRNTEVLKTLKAYK